MHVSNANEYNRSSGVSGLDGVASAAAAACPTVNSTACTGRFNEHSAYAKLGMIAGHTRIKLQSKLSFKQYTPNPVLGQYNLLPLAPSICLDLHAM